MSISLSHTIMQNRLAAVTLKHIALGKSNKCPDFPMAEKIKALTSYKKYQYLKGDEGWRWWVESYLYLIG